MNGLLGKLKQTRQEKALFGCHCLNLNNKPFFSIPKIPYSTNPFAIGL